MDLKQLRYFLAVAEEGQLTAAAQKLHITQPPLSYQLAALERELGTTLLERGPRGVRLTEAGELLKARASQILDLASSAVRELENFDKGLQGTLAIGTISSSGGVVPNRHMLAFTREHPKVRFEIHEGNSFEVIDMLERGVIDLGVVRTPFQSTGLECRYAPPEPMMALVPPGHRCGEQADSVSLEELQGQPLILYRRFEALLRQVFGQHGLTPTLYCVNDDARTTMAWAGAGFGVGIVPQSALLMPADDGLVRKAIRCEELTTRLAVIWVGQRYLSPLARAFVELFESTILQ